MQTNDQRTAPMLFFFYLLFVVHKKYLFEIYQLAVVFAVNKKTRFSINDIIHLYLLPV